MSYDFIKELAEPSVIYEEDPNEPDNPEVLVNGVGRYKLKSLEKNVRAKMADLHKSAEYTANTRHKNLGDSEAWRSLQSKLKHAAMHEMIKTIIAAKKELEERSNDETE